MNEPERPVPGGFQRAQIGVGDEEQARRLTMPLDVQAAQPSVVRLRDWALERLRLRPGETVVDVGSGTGGAVVRFAAEVGPGGRAVGVEPNPALRGGGMLAMSGPAAVAAGALTADEMATLLADLEAAATAETRSSR